MNPSLFQSTPSKGSPKYVAPADTRNAAGGTAYKRGPKDKLAQFAVTGCLSDTFYASAEVQLKEILGLANDTAIDSKFLAQTAVYARGANMKDMPALLSAMLVVRSSAGDVAASGLFRAVAPKVLDNLKMVANFVKILRSGLVQTAIVGGKSTSLPRPARKYVAQFLRDRNPERLLNDSTGIDPALGDIIKMVHPKPKSAAQAAVFAYFMGKTTGAATLAELPKSVRDFEAFKAGTASTADRLGLIGSINFRRLDSLGLTDAEWAEIAKSASWQTARMNLATFARHNVLTDKTIVATLAAKLRDPDQIKKSRALPYQLYVAHEMTKSNTAVPQSLTGALHDAFEVAVANTPKFAGDTLVAVDLSSSMNTPVTGRQGSKTPSKVSCREAAALFASSILRVNPDSTRIMGFTTEAKEARLNPRDSVFTNASKLAGLLSGGTACSAPVLLAIQNKIKVDTIVLLSDSESWADSIGTPNGYYSQYSAGGTGLAKAWAQYREKINPKARLICIDLAPNTTAQVTQSDTTGIYHVGGFSDAVFEYIAHITTAPSGSRNWTALIEQVQLDTASEAPVQAEPSAATTVDPE